MPVFFGVFSKRPKFMKHGRYFLPLPTSDIFHIQRFQIEKSNDRCRTVSFAVFIEWKDLALGTRISYHFSIKNSIMKLVISLVYQRDDTIYGGRAARVRE